MPFVNMGNRRQDALYEDVADIYEPMPLETQTGSKRMKDRKVKAVKIATNVNGMFVSKSESAEGGGPAGRNEQDLVSFSVDRWRTRADAKRDDGTPLVLNDNFWINLKTTGHPDRLGWWQCQGGAKMRPSRTRRNINTQTVNIKKALKPYGVD